jgi:hypothetical protein
LENDRGAVLTVRAAARGLIDFRQAELLDPDWWRRYNIMIAGMSRDDDFDLQTKVMDFHLALVSNSGLTEDSFKSSQANARETFYDIIAVTRPWEMGSKDQRQEKLLNDSYDAYKAAFGEDLRDPEFKERNKADVAQWKLDRELEEANSPDAIEAIVHRKITERNQKLAVMRKQLAQRKLRQTQGR